LEATPDYLYSQGTPERIKEYLNGHDISIVISLRNPIDRIISWFNYSKQIGFISQKMTFDEFIDISVKGENKNLPFIVLEQGKYTKYIQKYFSLFNQIKIIIFEELINEKESTILDLLNYLQIDTSILGSNDFNKLNESRSTSFGIIHRIYANTFRISKDFAVNFGFQNNTILKNMNTFVKSLLDSNAVSAKKQKNKLFEKKKLTNKQLNILVDFYQHDVIQLQTKVNVLKYWVEFR